MGDLQRLRDRPRKWEECPQGSRGGSHFRNITNGRKDSLQVTYFHKTRQKNKLQWKRKEMSVPSQLLGLTAFYFSLKTDGAVPRVHGPGWVPHLQEVAPGDRAERSPVAKVSLRWYISRLQVSQLVSQVENNISQVFFFLRFLSSSEYNLQALSMLPTKRSSQKMKPKSPNRRLTMLTTTKMKSSEERGGKKVSFHFKRNLKCDR